MVESKLNFTFWDQAIKFDDTRFYFAKKEYSLGMVDYLIQALDFCTGSLYNKYIQASA